MLTNKLLTLSPPLSGSEKKQRFGTINELILVTCQSVSAPFTTIFKDAIGIHSTLARLLQGIK